ncbi:MAG: hypothetical protein ABGZ17_21405, partial [Planctomycetaceae bacterium]
MQRSWPVFPLIVIFAFNNLPADELSDSAGIKTVKLFTVPEYCEGVVFDHNGRGYISHGKTITRFTLDGKHAEWAVTGAPNG